MTQKALFRTVVFVLLLFLLGVVATPVWAQAVFGRVIGTVTDPSGAVIAHAAVLIKDKDRGTEYHTTTNAQGDYAQGQLLAGTYSVTVMADGFGNFASSAAVHVDTTVEVNAQMAVGSLSGTVQVTDDTPLLQVDRAEVSTTLTTTEIENITVIDLT